MKRWARPAMLRGETTSVVNPISLRSTEGWVSGRNAVVRGSYTTGVIFHPTIESMDDTSQRSERWARPALLRCEPATIQRQTRNGSTSA